MAATVQDQISVSNLQGFDQPLSIQIISKTQDWQTRQRIAYESILLYLKQEFLSLTDWSEQINIFSQANPPYLNGPYSAIQSLTGRNRLIAMRLVELGDLGQVGNFLASIGNFDKVFVAEDSVLSNPADLEQRLGL